MKTIILGNKSDLAHEREVEYHEGLDLAIKKHAFFSEVSAKNGSEIKSSLNLIASKTFNNDLNSKKKSFNLEAKDTRKNCCIVQ